MRKNLNRNGDADDLALPLDDAQNTRRRQAGLRKRENRQRKRRPLYRYLQGRVGSPWKSVYSDICHHLSGRGWVEVDTRERVNILAVETKVYIDPDGQLLDHRGSRLMGGDFYVHPFTGNLLRVPAAKRGEPWRKRTTHLQVPIDETRRWVRIKGIWYAVLLAPIQEGKELAADIVFGEFDTNGELQGTRLSRLNWEWGASLYAVSKLQANKTEIKQINRALRKEPYRVPSKRKGRSICYSQRQAPGQLAGGQRLRKSKNSPAAKLRVVDQSVMMVPFEGVVLR